MRPFVQIQAHGVEFENAPKECSGKGKIIK